MIRCLRTKDNRLRPCTFCDKCGERIVKHTDGIIHHMNDGTVRHVHKLHTGKPCDAAKDDEDGWEELGHHAIRVLANLGIGPKEYAKLFDDARQLRSLV